MTQPVDAAWTDLLALSEAEIVERFTTRGYRDDHGHLLGHDVEFLVVVHAAVQGQVPPAASRTPRLQLTELQNQTICAVLASVAEDAAHRMSAAELDALLAGVRRALVGQMRAIDEVPVVSPRGVIEATKPVRSTDEYSEFVLPDGATLMLPAGYGLENATTTGHRVCLALRVPIEPWRGPSDRRRAPEGRESGSEPSSEAPSAHRPAGQSMSDPDRRAPAAGSLPGSSPSR